VPVFASEQDVYDHLGRLFEEMLADPVSASHFQRADTIVQYRSTDPDACLTVDLRQDRDAAVYFGACDLEPEVVMTMQTDTAHRFWLGQVNLTVALARGVIRAQGPVAKILKLVPLAKPFFPRYQELMQREGRAELVPA
jgi:hypothetical protein